MTTVEGIFRNGKVELLEPPPPAAEGRVVVTFLSEPRAIDLASRGIDERQAADLRARLATVAEDWDRPEMSIYDEHGGQSGDRASDRD